MYGLKCLLSQFMLLPAQYLQVRDDRGIFKKFSFSAARCDFTSEVWECMDRVSGIRLQWQCRIAGIRRMLLAPSFPFRRQCVRRFAPPVPPDLSALLTPGLFHDMRRLTSEMAFRLGMSL